MTDAIAFDTHRFVKHLTESGFTEQQAEALAKEQVQLLNSNLATKVDILALKADIEGVKAEVKNVKAELEAKIEMVKAELDAKIEGVKADVKNVKAELEAKIEMVKAELEVKIESIKTDIQATKVDLVKWMVMAMIAQSTLIVAFIKLL